MLAGCTKWIKQVDIKSSERRNHTNENSAQWMWTGLVMKRTKSYGIEQNRHAAFKRQSSISSLTRYYLTSCYASSSN